MNRHTQEEEVGKAIIRGENISFSNFKFLAKDYFGSLSEDNWVKEYNDYAEWRGFNEGGSLTEYIKELKEIESNIQNR